MSTLSQAETSHMLKHHFNKHQEEEGEISFTMKIIKQHKSSFSRQTHEAVMIEMINTVRSLPNDIIKAN